MGNVVSRMFGATPDPYNNTNNEIRKHHEVGKQVRAAEQAGTDLPETKKRAKKLKEEALKMQSEARERAEADVRKLQEAERAGQQARVSARGAIKQAKQGGEKIESREKNMMEKEAKAKHAAENVQQVLLNVKEYREEINTMASSHQEGTGARVVADTDMQQKQVRPVPSRREGLKISIQPEVWPTEEEFQLAKKRIQYDPEKIHFAVCGSSGSGKSSLVNAFRGLKNNSPHAARTDVIEATRHITRYPDPQQEMPYKRLVWFDCPGAGTLKIPGWQYFNQQGLFIFDVIVLVYDTRFTEVDMSIIQNCELFKIPLFIVRSKADTHIRNLMRDLGYDEDDDDAEINHKECQEQARQLLIDKTKRNLKENLEDAGLAMHDNFIVSSSVIYSLVTPKQNKKRTTPMIDEARLIDSVLKTAYERRYNTQSSRAILSRGKFSSPMSKQDSTHQLSEAERSKRTVRRQLGDDERDESDHKLTFHMPIASDPSPNAHQLSEERHMPMGPSPLMPT